VHVAKLLNSLALAPDVEIIIPGLPKRGTGDLTSQFARNRLFQHLQSQGELGSLRFANQQMNVLRHDNKSSHKEAIPLPRPLESVNKNISVFGLRQQGLTMVARKSDIVKMPGLLVALEM